MASAPINPTNLTPPRVDFLDPRTGAISREWYRFFLSLLTATQANQDESELAPNVSSLLAAYDATFANAIQALGVDAIAASESAIADIQTEIQSLSLAPPPKQFRTPRYGSFYDTTTQNAAAINTAYPVTLNTTDLSFGVTRGSPTSRIFVDRPNVYNIQFSAQLRNTSGGAHGIWIWFRKNGTDVPDSATKVRIQGNNTEAVAAWNYLLEMNAGDYFELMWEVDDLGVQLFADPATAIHPEIPSVIVTVTHNVSTLEV
jgi:hypothetical protein